MRILYLSPTEPYPGTHAGFTHVHNLLKNLCNEGVEVSLIAGPEGKDAKALPPVIGLEVHHIYASNPVQRNLRALGKVLSLTKKIRFDLIHERMEMVGGVGIKASGITRIPLILEVNDPFLELNAPEGLQGILRMAKRLQFSHADAIICQTPQLKRAIWSEAADRRVFVIPNGADPAAFPPREFPKERRIGFMGSFMPWHGVRSLIQAFAEVLGEVPDAELLLIGDPGKQKGEVERDLRESGIEEKVKLTGPVESTQIPDLLASCRVLAAPFDPELDPVRKDHYRRFGFWWSPLKIFEYMASSRPVVSPTLGMIPTYLKDSGLTYSPGDVDALCEGLISLLEDEELARRLGGNGRERVEKIYNWRNIAHMTMMAYMNVLERGRKG